MVKKRLYFANFHAKFTYFFYAPFVLILMIAFLVVIIYELANSHNIALFVFYLMGALVFLIIQIPLVGVFSEYYILDFSKNIIQVKSLLDNKKTVNLDDIKSIYWQEMPRLTLITKRYFYIVDDGSSTTIKLPLSTQQDLMRIPIDKKSKAIIASIWPHEIKESHFPERR